LRKTDEISSVFAFKCQENGEYLRILARPNRLEFSRLAVIVSKKNAPSAVARNYIKRALRERFRTRTNLRGLDVVILVRNAFSRTEIGKVEIELLSLLSGLQKKASTRSMAATTK